MTHAISQSRYSEAIHRTNVTGLGSKRDYEIGFRPVAMEYRAFLCGKAPLLTLVDRNHAIVTGAAAVVIHPPGEPLPDHTLEDLRTMQDVVMASGAQVLEARESADLSVAANFSIQGRIEAATLYLALGDEEGSVIRELVWERRQGEWQHTRYAREVSATKGLSRREYKDLCQVLAPGLPAADHPLVRAKRQGTASRKAKRRRMHEPPWITFTDIIDLLAGRATQTSAGQDRSDPVRQPLIDDRVRPSTTTWRPA